jgi:hypothetical protein
MSILRVGRDNISDLLISTGAGSGNAGQAYNSTGAMLCDGVSTCAEDTASTFLWGASSGYMQAMNATYPLSSGTNVKIFQATYTTSQACFAWNEWGIHNATVSSTGRMLNRKLESPSLGTKTCSQSWQFTATITITT